MFKQDNYQVAILHNVPDAGYGHYFIYKFPNGYTALVLKNQKTFDGYRSHYILEFQNSSGSVFTYPDFCGLIKTPGYMLDEEDVEEILETIRKLPSAI